MHCFAVQVPRPAALPESSIFLRLALGRRALPGPLHRCPQAQHRRQHGWAVLHLMSLLALPYLRKLKSATPYISCETVSRFKCN